MLTATGGTVRTEKARTLALGFLTLLVAAALGVLAARPAHAATFTVNSTGDAGDQAPNGSCDTGVRIPDPGGGLGTVSECTLRAALQENNANDNGLTITDAINFNIGGGGVRTISPESALPTISESVSIDGYSQPGARENTSAVGTNAVLLVELNGVNAAASQAGLVVAAPSSSVEGLVINRFSGNGVEIGGSETGTVAGNFIGTDATGTRDRGNAGAGVATSGPDTTVGGASLAARNLISGNGGDGFSTGDFESLVRGNLIGTDRTGTKPLGNGDDGVSLFRSGTVGGDDAASANVIAFNAGDGVAVRDTDNRILRNSVFSNGEQGIDLGEDGPTVNDGVGDADVGPNDLQNKPVISSARNSRRATTINVRLESAPGASYTFRFFSNPKGTKDEGKKFIGQQNVLDIEGDGIVVLAFKPRGKVKAGMFVTATVTNDSSEDTSEFSTPKKVLG